MIENYELVRKHFEDLVPGPVALRPLKLADVAQVVERDMGDEFLRLLGQVHALESKAWYEGELVRQWERAKP